MFEKSSSKAPSMLEQMLKIYGLGRPYAGRLVICLTLIMLVSITTLMLPLGIGRLFDKLGDGHDDGYVSIIALSLLLLFVARGVLSFFGQYILQSTGDRISCDLRVNLFCHIHGLSIDFHHRQRTGDLLSRLNNDILSIKNIISGIMITFIMSGLQLIGASVIMLIMNWRLGLLVLSMAPLASMVSHVFGPVFRKLSLRIQNELGQSSSLAQETLAGVEVVASFGRHQYEVGRYKALTERFLFAALGARKVDAVFSALIAFISSSSTIATIWLGGSEVVAGGLSVGALVSFLLYSQNVTQGISALAQQYSAVNQSIGASMRVFEILESAPKVADRRRAVPLNTSAALIVFDDVTFAYDDSLILKNISIEARAGEMIALVGASGSGKSTLLKLIPRLYDVSSGSIRINGTDVRDYDLQSVRDAVAVVPQDVFLFASTVRENIRYGRLEATDEEVEAAARAANAHEFIERIPGGYDAPIGERGIQLSGGQRQRLSIARALVKKAPILLLDEATSSVDSGSDVLISEAIERVKASCTVFISAHRLETVRSADQIILLNDGVIVGRPTFEEVAALFCRTTSSQEA
ncbi:ABC transporter ATP-binding protein [Dyella subtropica]|uniref:ABC transporter ATP-binding protein n=1 Tax=Dyella subtropica TaxID=2992127 RepID=UPI0022542703|nr:ABC transporter ATP-binding protein [Dyella subtropica]